MLELQSFIIALRETKQSFTGQVCHVAININDNEIFNDLRLKHPEYEMKLSYVGTDEGKWMSGIEIRRIEPPTTGRSYQYIYPVCDSKEKAIRSACAEMDEWLTHNTLR